MEIPEYFHVRKNKPGRTNFVLRWVGYKTRTFGVYISIFGTTLFQKGQYEKKIEMPDYSKIWGAKKE